MVNISISHQGFTDPLNLILVFNATNDAERLKKKKSYNKQVKSHFIMTDLG